MEVQNKSKQPHIEFLEWKVVMSRRPIKTEALEILKSRGVPIGTVLDVGVLYGTPELMSAFPTVPHLLFEPVEEFYSTIRSNYALHKYELFKVAVSDQNGDISLQTQKKVEGMEISHSSMVFRNTDALQNVRIVEMTTLDSLMAGRQDSKPYLLKIDIDGHEMRVLRGATETLKNCSVVIVECVHSRLPEIVSHVLNGGFRLFDLVEPCYYDKVFWQCDAVFLRCDFFASCFEDLLHQVKPGMFEMFKN